MQMGPGVSTDGSVLWTPDKKHQEIFNLKLSGDLIPKGKFDPDAIDMSIKDKKPTITKSSLDNNSKDKFLFNEENLAPTNSIPLHTSINDRDTSKLTDRERRRLEEKNKHKDKQIELLNQEIKSAHSKHLDMRTEEALSIRDSYDKNGSKREQNENMSILQQKYDNKVEDVKDYYKQKISRLEKELRRNRSGSPSDPRDTKPPPHASQLPYSANYLADPSLYHPSFYPPDDRSRLIGQSRYIDEDLKILPPPPHIPLELPTTFDLSRDDEIAFVKLGIKDEILKHDSLNKPDIEIEMKNPLQASEFVFRFIAFKPPLAMPFGQTVPRRMYFRFNFFTFPEKKTTECELKDPVGGSEMTRELIPGQQYLLERVGKAQLSEFRSVEAEFTIDKSISKIYDENLQFYEYLLEREVSIDIFDADSHLHYGTCRVNLSSMLKQTRSGVVRAKNCEIASFESSNRSITGAVNMGHLQILMSHQGKRESEVSNLNAEKAVDDNDFLEDRKQPSQKHKYNKKVRSKPINALFEEYIANKPDDMYEKVIEEQFNIEEEESEDIRKKMRIERIKQFKLKQKVLVDYEQRIQNSHRPEEVINLVADPSKPEWMKNQSLRQIETLRDYTKPHIIEKVLKDHIKSLKQLYIVPGTPSFFKYNLKNPFTSRTVFTINIIDQDKLYLGEHKEFKLVNNHNFEWEFWHSRRK